MAARVLIYGGNGALGQVCVNSFKAKNVWVCSIDLKPNETADANIIVTELNDWQKQDKQVRDRVSEVLKGEKLDGIFNVAGGWAGGNAASKDMVKNADMMWKQSVWSSAISASLAANFLKESGVITLPGAAPCLGGTSGMMGYGMAKAAVHQLTKSLGQKCGIPEDSTALCVLPVTLDTPMNRKFMPDADQTAWTPLEFLATLFDNWLNGKDKPATGSLVKVVTKDGHSSTEIVPC